MSRADSEFITDTPVPMPDNVRRLLEDAIRSHLDAAEALILVLDETDGDPDLEDNGDAEPGNDEEPSLGWTVDGVLGGGGSHTEIDIEIGEQSERGDERKPRRAR